MQSYNASAMDNLLTHCQMGEGYFTFRAESCKLFMKANMKVYCRQKINVFLRFTELSRKVDCIF